MKKKLLDRKIYLEGLRQTKVSGLFLLIITVLGSALAPLNIILFASDGGTLTSMGYYHTISVSLSLEEFTPLLALFMFVGPIVLTMQLFSFLNKRNSSDFYHALPCTRTCLTLSFSLAIVTWLAATMLLTVLVNGLLYTIGLPGSISWLFLPYSFFLYFCGSLLVMAVMLLAKSLTGTGVSNLGLAAVIGFLPRILMVTATGVFAGMIPIIDVSETGFFMNTAYNIPANMVIGLFTGRLDSYDYTFIPGMLATLVLAVVYFGIALFLFGRRKSEVAQKSAPNRVLQHIFRCLVTVPITLVIPVLVLEESADMTTMIVILFVAAIIYFGYELLTTRKAKNLLGALPVFAVVLLFDILFGVSIVGAKNMVLNDVPDATDIKSVHMQQDMDWSYDHYNRLLSENFYIENADIAQRVSNALQTTVDSVKNDTYYNTINHSIWKSEPYTVSIKKKNGFVIKRKILFSANEIEMLRELYAEDPDYQKLLVQLPEQESIERITLNYVFNGETTNRIWESFCQEYEALSYEEKLVLNGLAEPEKYSASYTVMNVSGYLGVTAYNAPYLIDKTMTPKTYQLYLSATMASTSGRNFMEAFWKDFESEDGMDSDYGLFLEYINGEETMEFTCDIYRDGDGVIDAAPYNREVLQTLLTPLKDAALRPVGTEHYFCTLTVKAYDDLSADVPSVVDINSCYVTLTKEEFAALHPYMTTAKEGVA